MKLLDLIQALSTKAVKKIAYSVLVLLIAVDFIIPRHEIHFYRLCINYYRFQMDRSYGTYEERELL